jgi:uncharacterized protein (TIGR02246 family)
MPHVRMGVIVMAAVAGLAGAPGTADAPPSREEVQRFVRLYNDASNDSDPTAFMDMISRKPDVSTAAAGVINRGWEAIRSEADKLAGTQGTHRVSLGSMDVTFLGPGYALVVAPVTVDLSVGENQAQMHGAMSLVLEKSSGKWKVLHEHDSLQFPLGDIPESLAN